MLNTRFERLLVTKECVKLQIGESVLFGIVSHFSWMARGHSVIKRFGLHLTVSNGSGLIWDNPKHFLRNLYCGIFCGIWFYASDEKIFGNYRFAIKYISQRSVLQVIQMKKKRMMIIIAFILIYTYIFGIHWNSCISFNNKKLNKLRKKN